MLGRRESPATKLELTDILSTGAESIVAAGSGEGDTLPLGVKLENDKRGQNASNGSQE